MIDWKKKRPKTITKKRKVKPKNLTWWKKKAWKLFSEFIRLRDAIETTGTDYSLICFTCGKPYPAFGTGCAQAGHFVPGRSHILLFEEHGVHGQCYNCNINLKGSPQNYRDNMIKKYGIEETERIEMSRFKGTFKYTIPDLQELCEKYKLKTETLRTESENGTATKKSGGIGSRKKKETVGGCSCAGSSESDV